MAGCICCPVLTVSTSKYVFVMLWGGSGAESRITLLQIWLLVLCVQVVLIIFPQCDRYGVTAKRGVVHISAEIDLVCEIPTPLFKEGQ